MERVGFAWKYKDETTKLPVYKFSLSAAALMQKKTDELGNINILIRPLDKPNSRTKATHFVYITNSDKQSFDEQAEILLSVNRKLTKDCFLLNGFYTFLAKPDKKETKFKKLNAYYYHIHEEAIDKDSDTLKSNKNLGYGYLKVQVNLEYHEKEIGRVFKSTEAGNEGYIIYIDKVKVLEFSNIEKNRFYLKAAAISDKPSEYKLLFTGVIEEENDLLFFSIDRLKFARLGFSDNNGHVIFVAYQSVDSGKDELQLYYVNYNTENVIRTKTEFTDGVGWMGAAMKN